MRASPMSRSRCFGSRSRQRPMSRKSLGGVVAGSASKRTSSLRTLASTSAIESASPLDDARGDPEDLEGSNNRRPVSIS
jgi:hypothetical protein